MSKVLYQITAPHFTAGIEVDDVSEVVVYSAPILGWMRGDDLRYVQRYCEKKNWSIKKIENKEQDK